jgi:hypothetical protein
MTDRATLCRVFNEAYEKAMRGPTASTALGDALMAVRAETLREVRGIIADVKAGGDDFADNADEKFGWDQACDCVHNSLALKDTLTALAHPEGTDK